MMIHDEGGRPDFIPPVDPLRPNLAPPGDEEQVAPEPTGEGDLGIDLQDFDKTPEQEAEAKAICGEHP